MQAPHQGVRKLLHYTVMFARLHAAFTPLTLPVPECYAKMPVIRMGKRMFWKRKKPTLADTGEQPLYECNPAELDLDMLHHLQAGLTAKLLIANREIVGHYEKVLTQASAESIEDPRTRELAELTERLKKINVVLDSELARFQQGFQQPTRH